jgi:cytochrome c553
MALATRHVIFGAAIAAAAAAAATATTASAGGDAAAGKAKSLACQACHITADPASATPRLVGQRAAYLAAELAAFKAGERTSELMTPIASQLSEADIADLAAFWSAQGADADATVPADVKAIAASPMTFPKGFPKGYTVYATAPDAANNSIQISYVNKTALTAAKAKKPLPDGSAIMVVVYAAKLDAAGKPAVGKDGAWIADKALSYSGMEAKKGWGKPIPELLRNDNWAYNLWGADQKPRTLNQAVCLACHKPTASTSYVFTLDKITAASGAK